MRAALVRNIVLGLCVVAVCVPHSVDDGLGRSLIADGSMVRMITPWWVHMAGCVALIWGLSALLVLRPDRLWAWLLLLPAWALWVAAGRIVTMNLETGEIRGFYYVVATDRHTLRPANVEAQKYMCDAEVLPHGWWLDLEYGGVVEPVWLGPLIASEAAAQFHSLTTCR
jgi:hypothetical protein